jgi:hypothetical protein
VTTHEIRIDHTRPLTAEPDKGHCRWYPTSLRGPVPAPTRWKPNDGTSPARIKPTSTMLAPSALRARRG